MKQKRTWLISGGGLLLVLALAAVLLRQPGAGKAPAAAPPAGPDPAAWERRIAQEALSAQSEVERGIAAAVGLSVSKVTEEEIALTVAAPDISEELRAWFDGVSDEDYSDEALEREILALLDETPPAEQEFVLPLDEEGNVLYTLEFTECLGCGLFEFRRGLRQAALDALKEE